MGACWHRLLCGHDRGLVSAVSPAADRTTDPVEDPKSVRGRVRTTAAGLTHILTVSGAGALFRLLLAGVLLEVFWLGSVQLVLAWLPWCW